MKGRHDTVLVYVHEGGELEVGAVACVPSRGDVVLLHLPDGVVAHQVERVGWSVPAAAKPDAYAPTPITVVRVTLIRCP